MNAVQSTPQLHQHKVRQGFADVDFLKISGPTGDWIVFDEPPNQREFTPEQITWLCDRTHGIGACGVVKMTVPQASAQHPEYHVQAWLADGTRPENLAEPARVATYALAALKKIPVEDTTHHVFHIGTELITTVYTPSYVGVDIGQWSYITPETGMAAGSDTLVMAAGLTDPRPGLGIRIQTPHVTVAVETFEELQGIDLSETPSLEPSPHEPTGLSFVVPQDPLIVEGMGRIALRHHPSLGSFHDLGSAATAATVSFQLWTGLTQLTIWNVATPVGDIVVQLHDNQRVSTFITLNTVFSGRL